VKIRKNVHGSATQASVSALVKEGLIMKKVSLRVEIGAEELKMLEELRDFWDRSIAAFDKANGFEHVPQTLSSAVEGCIRLTYDRLEREGYLRRG
jgi:hypothetical protein